MWDAPAGFKVLWLGLGLLEQILSYFAMLTVNVDDGSTDQHVESTRGLWMGIHHAPRSMLYMSVFYLQLLNRFTCQRLVRGMLNDGSSSSRSVT